MDDALNRTEFSGFLHPEDHPAMRDIVVLETLEDIDKDKVTFNYQLGNTVIVSSGSRRGRIDGRRGQKLLEWRRLNGRRKTWLTSRERGGCEWRRTSLFGEPFWEAYVQKG